MIAYSCLAVMATLLSIPFHGFTPMLGSSASMAARVKSCVNWWPAAYWVDKIMIQREHCYQNDPTNDY